MIRFLHKTIPNYIFKLHYKVKLYMERQRNKKKYVADVFTDIYTSNKWGGSKGDYCSGPGTTDQEVSRAYIDTIYKVAKRE